ncbi:hypothetical protein E2562_031029 [Oryza meyeriana var. granulata]|uniref:Uncharacterized protein n=1 Tax=Oryza meyeriana var. granulata TaxID=110450 RepID=A0A6G1ERH9_9ORYZ|nr:hypothetical protein E2562_031029 [Oryza meyeriana var. granulata]
MRPRVVQQWSLIVLAMIVGSGLFAVTPAMARAARDVCRLHPLAPAARVSGQWNRGTATEESGGGVKWEVPGGPDPQHHH